MNKRLEWRVEYLRIAGDSSVLHRYLVRQSAGGRTITKLARHWPVDEEVAQPRAHGQVRLSVKARAGRSALEGLRVAGSMKCVFPRQRSQALDGVLVNTAGGITGGDRFSVSAEIGAGAALTLTTQAAERAYRAQPGETGLLETRVRVRVDGCLHWLPQETILFDGASFRRRLVVEMDGTARLLMAEPLVFGRAAMGEAVRDAMFRDRIDIRRDGKLILADRTVLEGDIQAQLDRVFVAGGAGAMALVVGISRDMAGKVDAVRRMLAPSAGASLIGEDVLVVRCLAADGYALRQTLVPVLAALSGTEIPKCWML